VERCCHAHFLDVNVRSSSRFINVSVLFSVSYGRKWNLCTHTDKHFENWSLPYPIKHYYCIASFINKIFSTVLLHLHYIYITFTLYPSFVTCECRIPFFVSFSSSPCWIFLMEISSIFMEDSLFLLIFLYILLDLSDWDFSIFMASCLVSERHGTAH